MVKKVFSIDAERLEQGHAEMVGRMRTVQQRADFEFSIDWKNIIQALEKNIVLKSKTDIVEEPAEEEESRIEPAVEEERPPLDVNQ